MRTSVLSRSRAVRGSMTRPRGALLRRASSCRGPGGVVIASYTSTYDQAERLVQTVEGPRRIGPEQAVTDALGVRRSGSYGTALNSMLNPLRGDAGVEETLRQLQAQTNGVEATSGLPSPRQGLAQYPRLADCITLCYALATGCMNFCRRVLPPSRCALLPKACAKCYAACNIVLGVCVAACYVRYGIIREERPVPLWTS